ncbi:MAG: response regulator [Candidatus Omnitrophota bacterium]
MPKPAILICDDEEGIRESFRLILSRAYDLTFAESGAEALRLLKSLSFNLLILDIKMPRQNGFEILRETKLANPELPVIIVTGYQSLEMAQEAHRQGAADYLPKPFKPEDIQKSVRLHLRPPTPNV